MKRQGLQSIRLPMRGLRILCFWAHYGLERATAGNAIYETLDLVNTLNRKHRFVLGRAVIGSLVHKEPPRAEINCLRIQRDALLEACDLAIACLQGECPGTARRILLAASIAAKEDK